jgi:hypothetical protein
MYAELHMSQDYKQNVDCSIHSWKYFLRTAIEAAKTVFIVLNIFAEKNDEKIFDFDSEHCFLCTS